MKIFERNPVKIDINEGAGPSMRLHFLALTSGIPTGNGRRYGGKLLQKASDEFNARVEKYGPAMGGTKHPEGDMNVEDVAMMINKTSFDEATGGLYVDATVLPTSKGRTISALLKAGAKIGCSVRGQGDVGSDGEVKSFSLKGCDLVLNPAQNNYVSMDNVYESLEIPEDDNEIVETRFREAVKAGFTGDLAAYRKVYIERLDEVKRADIGDLHAQSIKKSQELPKAADGFPATYAPGNPQKDGDEEDEDAILKGDNVTEAQANAVCEAIGKLGKFWDVEEIDEGVAYAFHLNESMFYKFAWTQLKTGEVHIGKPEVVEA